MPFIPKSTGIPTVDKVFKEVFAILNRFQVSWFDIINKPTVFPPESHTQDISTINNLQTTLDSKEPVIALGTGNKYLFRDKTWKEIDWNEIIDKPSSFTPSAHSHAIADVTSLQANLDGKLDKNHVLNNVYNYRSVYSIRFAGTTGTLKINLPSSWNNEYYRFEMRGYAYSPNIGTYGSWRYVGSGYANSTNSRWYLQGGHFLEGNPPFNQVRYTHDGSRCCILLGDTTTTWTNYETFPVFIDIDVITGGSISRDGWSYEVLTSEDGYAWGNIQSITPSIYGNNAVIPNSALIGKTTATPGGGYKLEVEGDTLVNGTLKANIPAKSTAASVFLTHDNNNTIKTRTAAQVLDDIGAASVEHIHAIADITSLQTTLDGKQPVHANLTSISNLSTTPSGRFLVTNGSAIVARPLQNSDLPAIATTDTFVVASQSAMLALSAAERGDVAVRTDLNKSFILKGDNPASLSDWQELLSPTDAVLSVDGRTGVVSLADKYQPLDSDLTVIAGLTHSNRHVMVSNGSSWTRRALEEADLPSLSISKITGLQSVLDGKSNTGHSHAWSEITGKPSTFTPSAHTLVSHSDWSTYFDQALKTTSSPTFASINISNGGLINDWTYLGTTHNPSSPYETRWYRVYELTGTGGADEDIELRVLGDANYYYGACIVRLKITRYYGEPANQLHVTITPISGWPSNALVKVDGGIIWVASNLKNGDIYGRLVQSRYDPGRVLFNTTPTQTEPAGVSINGTFGVKTYDGDSQNVVLHDVEGANGNFTGNVTVNGYSVWHSGNFDPSTKANAIHDHPWGDITGKPSTFAPASHGLVSSTHTVSGLTAGHVLKALSATTYGFAAIAWSDIASKPSTFTPSAHTHLWSEITDKPSSFTPSAHTHPWSEITGKPSTFTPSAHGLVSSTHTVSGLTTGHVLKALSATTYGFGAIAWSEIASKPSTFTPAAHTLVSHTDWSTYFDQALKTTSTPTFAGGNFTGQVNTNNINNTGFLQNTGYIASIYPSNSSTHYRDVYQYSTRTASFAGTMKFTLPKTWSRTMLTFTIKGYAFAAGQGAWECIISGYNYTDGWYNYSAEIRGSAPFSQVRLAHDGTKCCLLLGNPNTIWSIPQVAITEVFASYQNTSGWGEPYSMEFITGEDGITNIVTPLVNSGVGADWNALINKPSTFTPSTHGHPWGDITGKPSTFAPAAHGLVSSTHTVSGLTAGHVLKALSATTYGFAAITPADIGAPAIGTERSLSVTTAGWVTIATCAIGRAYGEFHVYDSASGRHNFTKIIASTSYGVNNVSVIGGNRFSTRSIAHVRVLYNTSDRTYGGAKLQVYCENPTFTLLVKQFLSQEFTNWKAWNDATPVAEGTPTGWAQDDSTYLQDITNPNHSFIGNVFSGKGLLLSGNATISGNTAFGKSTFVGGYRVEVEGNTLINGILTAGWVTASSGADIAILQIHDKIQILNKSGTGWLDFVTRDVSGSEAAANLSNVAQLNDINVFERGFYVNDGNMSIYGNRVNMSRRNVGGAATINITTNPQIIDLNDYAGVSRFDITTSMDDAPIVYFKNAIPGDEIFVKIVKSGSYPSEYDMALGWNIDPGDGTWMRYATKRYFHLICEGTAKAGGITANTWWIAGVHGLYQP